MCAQRAAWCRYDLHFNFDARTSRGSMTDKETYFIKVWDEERPDIFGLGECALFRGLSAEDNDGYEAKLNDLCASINAGRRIDISRYSSIKMGLETALLDLSNGGRRVIFPGDWVAGKDEIVINGLVWMGSKEQMLERIDQKLSQGFGCLKMKLGGVDWNDELRLLDHIRLAFGPDRLTLRVDANGAFTPDNAMARLNELANFDIHSIEQPIRQGQLDKMSYLCENSPVPIALDEELIGIDDLAGRRRLLYFVAPQYIVLKPSLCGGISGAMEWIHVAEERHIGWWITSALESNVGLNAIAQLTSQLGVGRTPQGLGTGALFTNNIPSPLRLKGDRLTSDPRAGWTLPELPWYEP